LGCVQVGTHVSLTHTRTIRTSASARTCKPAERISIVVSVRRLVLVRGRPVRGVMLSCKKHRKHMTKYESSRHGIEATCTSLLALALSCSLLLRFWLPVPLLSASGSL
jgi:hypothetical protein